MNQNNEFLEACDIVSAFVPVDMGAAANDGDWVNMRDYEKLVAVLFKAAGTAGQDPVFTLRQATDNAGTGAKALAFTRARTKIGTLTGVGQWTIATQAAANTYTPVSAASQALIAVEIQQSDLDASGGFTHVQLQIPDTGAAAQLGCALYILCGGKYGRKIPNSPL